ncbi:HU family DNA-binding protein [uncultured Bacteroides sp.]|uniref:HU family DNA-binding protein n=1 Tax=uncultured Bacteroides sp. TaxID=162156 RepID=UPI002AABC8BE|nr:HU family DNA-binding protein [uncultured Bacteroides sp.]
MSERLNMQNLIDLFAEKHKINKKDAELFVREFFTLIEETLEDEKYLKIKGLGTFKLIDVESRESVNVNTGERFEIQGHTKISFVPEPSLRELINKPFAHFETVILNEETVLEEDPTEDVESEVEDNSVELNDNTESNKIQAKQTNSIEEQKEIELPADDSLGSEKEANAAEEAKDSVSSADLDAEEILPASGKLSVDEIIALEIQKADAAYFKEAGSKNKKKSADNITANHDDKKSPLSYIISIVITIVVICIATVFFIYYPNTFDDLLGGSEEPLNLSLPDSTSQTISIPVDTFKIQDSVNPALEAPKDSIKEPKSISHQKETVDLEGHSNNKKTNPNSSTIPVIPDSVNYIITGMKTTYVLKKGETLTVVSLRFYGTKNLWPYIVKYNRDIIKNPNNVPYNTKLKIPELKKK